MPQPFNLIYPRRVNRLVNHAELWILFLPAQRFTAFVDDVVINDERDAFCPALGSAKVFQQADKQHLTFIVAAHVADLTGSAL